MKHTKVRMWVAGLVVVCASQTGYAQGNVASDKALPSDMRAVAALLDRLVTVDLSRVSLKQAIDAVAEKAGVWVQYQEPLLAPYPKPVTVHARSTPLRIVLDQILTGTALRVVPDGTTQLAIVGSRMAKGEALAGTITGKVTDAATKRPLRGATVTLDDAPRGVQTTDDGTFQLSGVSVGSHRMAVRLLGYVHEIKTVMVSEGTVTSVEIALAQGISTLDQVVVTGTIIPTELKAVPNAITVITAKQIEERGITQIQQLFRGDVPGLFVQNQGSFNPLGQVMMFSRGAANVDPSTATLISGMKPIKTYVDGIELADPSYLNQIDPRSIERIEILAGPQASTIYGSGAINGVMQVFTKRNTMTKPQLTMSLLSGVIQNDFSSALTPQHDYSAQVGGTEGTWSYTAGGAWNYIGRWTPAIQQRTTSGFAGGRMRIGRIMADASFRTSTSLNRRRGDAYQRMTMFQTSGLYQVNALAGYSPPVDLSAAGMTLGLTLGYTPTAWWSHEMVLGTDDVTEEQRQMVGGYILPLDTLLFFLHSTNHRSSLRYTTTAVTPMTGWSQLTVTTGVDSWNNLTTSLNTSPTSLTGVLSGSPWVQRQPGHNTGGFIQGQLSVSDALFLTYGLRFEWNPNYGADVDPNRAPRYGVSYVRDFTTPWGPMTAKVRGSYGRSTEPPTVDQKKARLGQVFYDYLTPFFGNFVDRLENPALVPSSQQGGEGGVELYVGNRISLAVTHYNQTVNNLIFEMMGADSIRSLQVFPECLDFGGCDHLDPAGYGIFLQSENLNIGSIRNQGWELQGSLHTGPLGAKGTYSWTKSRFIGVTPQYRALSPLGLLYQPGDAFRDFPEHVWAFGVTYAQTRTSIAMGVTGTAQVFGQNDDLYYRQLNSQIRLKNDRMRWSGSRLVPFGGNALVDVNAEYRLSKMVEGVVHVQNVMNYYRNEFNTLGAALGRQSKIGVKVRTN